jgi:surfeit locus 1 family protein
MSIYFRPLAGFTIAAAILFAFLIGLGVWQLERLRWKLALIASVERNLTAPPLSLDSMLKMGEGAQYRRVALSGRFDNAKEAYVFATDKDGLPVFHVLVPFLTGEGTLMVDRGIVPPPLRDPALRKSGEIAGADHIVGIWRTPDAPGFFTPAPDLAHRIWYSHNASAIAAADHVKLIAPVVVEADAAPNPGGWPKGGQTQVTFRNEHLQYAITWFALAGGLLGVYIAYHMSKGRLSVRM